MTRNLLCSMIAFGAGLVVLSGQGFAKPMANPSDGCLFFAEGCHGGDAGSGARGGAGMPSSGAGGHKILRGGMIVFKGDTIKGTRPCAKCGGK
jgi:hypothetical protein